MRNFIFLILITLVACTPATLKTVSTINLTPPTNTEPGLTKTPTTTSIGTLVPTATAEATATATATEISTTEESVNVESLNPAINWFVVRDKGSTGTYKRVMTGEYKLVRDSNGRIIDAHDSSGNEVDAKLFEKGGYYFGWKGVNVKTTGGITIASVGVINTGVVVESKDVENGVNYDLESVKILVGITDTEFQEYLMPFSYTRHDPNLGDQTDSLLYVTLSGGESLLTNESEIINMLSYKENINKQIGVNFQVGILPLTQLEAQDKITITGIDLAWYNVVNDMKRPGLASKSQWPPAGGVFGETEEITTLFSSP